MSYSKGPRRDLTPSVAMQVELLASRLRTIRESQGFSILDVNRMTGISESTIGYIERFRQVPALDTVLTLADFYGYTFDLVPEERD